MGRRLTAGLVVLAVAGAGGAGAWAASADRTSPSRAATDRPCERAYVDPEVVGPAPPVRVRLRPLVQLRSPVALAFMPGRDVGIVGERGGRLRMIDGERIAARAVVDLSGDTRQEGDTGLLALAYSPAGDWLYVYRTAENYHEVVTAYPVRDGEPDQAGERVILDIAHPRSNQHHGGGFAFGPDGLLYIGTGDGGGLGDPRGNAQDLGTLLGKVLRVEPTPEAAEPYRVPADNPFVDRRGARPEIFSLGLRNPFRLSFDSATGDLWIGDVGQSCWEELNHRPAGQQGGENFGWDHREGTHRFEGGGPGGFEDPVLNYAHRGGSCAVVAGFTYRGTALRGWEDLFLYTDFCRGRLYGLRLADGDPPEVVDLGYDVDHPTAVVPGPDGEPWVVSLDGPVYRVEPATR